MTTPVRAPAVPLAVAALALMLGACASPAYYTQAISGHLDLMRARQPVDDYLDQAPPGDPAAERLALAMDLLAFAEAELDLPSDGSYDSYAPTPDKAVTWNVVATPPYSLDPKRWCFPVAGCVPYRGYFDRDDAERFADRMRGKGRDVSVSGASAYSTLGWFDDPLLDTMLEGPDTDLADTLFHELAHQRLYVAGATDFNESYATFVGREGVRAWMRTAGRDDELDRWEERQEATRAFLALLADTRAALAGRYAAGGPEAQLAADKARLFDQLREDYDRLVRESWNGVDRFGAWFDPPPNNADLALVGVYVGGLCAFEGLWRRAGADFRQFHDLARERGRLPAEDRARWLASPCPETAP